MAVNYDMIRKNYEKDINIDLAGAKRKATQLNMARASASGLSSASLGSDLTDYFASLESTALAQKNQLSKTFAILQAQEQARADEFKRMQRAQASQAWTSALGSLAGTAVGSIFGPVGAAAGGNIASSLFGDQQSSVPQQKVSPTSFPYATKTGTNYRFMVPSDIWGK